MELDGLANGAIAVIDGAIAWVGIISELPKKFAAAKRIDVQAKLITPALIDCHTHLVFAGNRADEFAARLRGKSYTDIANAGGGIMSTVRHTRAATVDQLIEQSLPRARNLIADGVACIEIKSGYGLDFATERNMLLAAREIGRLLNITVLTTFLALHALPPEARSPDARKLWIDSVINNDLPRLVAEGLVDAVDAFCEHIAFSTAEVEQLFAAAARLGVRCKLHAEQLSNSKGSELAARFRALSVDHLEYLDADGIAAIKASGTIATLLPAAYYCLKETQLPPIAALRAAGVPMAVASDCNPGTSPQSSLRLALHQACTLFGLRIEEALAGATVHAAAALGFKDRGQISIGQLAEFAIWDAQSAAEIVYWIGGLGVRILRVD
jgi:imidazolonepropionase